MRTRDLRRAALTVGLLFVGLPMLTVTHPQCLGTDLDEIPVGYSIERPEQPSSFYADHPDPTGGEAWIGTDLRFGVPLEVIDSVELSLRDVTDGPDGPVLDVELEYQEEDPWVHRWIARPAEALLPFGVFLAEVVFCGADGLDAPGTCQAVAWTFETQDVGLPLTEGTEPAAVGFALDTREVEIWAPASMAMWAQVALQDVGTLLLTSAPVEDGSATWISRDDPDTQSVEQDPCFVTYKLPGEWSDDPPMAKFGPMDIPVAAGPYQGTVWSLGGTVLLAPDGSRALISGIRATVDTRLYDQHMIEGGAVTCDFSICEARRNTPDPFRVASLQLLSRVPGGETVRRADDWYIGYTCDLLPSLGTECDDCPDGSEDACLTFEFQPAWASAADAPVQPCSVDDVLEDPFCS